MMVTTARYATEHGAKYLQQLCKHFAHKVEVAFDDRRGRAALSTGPADLMADAGGLTVRLEAEDAKSIIQARYTIDSHLVNFAYREGFTGLDWRIEQA